MSTISDKLRRSGRDLCPHCLAEFGQFDHFCRNCGGPTTSHASIDPMGHIYALGYGVGKITTEPRPRLIVVLGAWLIFAPQVFVYLLMTASNISQLLRGGDVGDFTFGAMTGFAPIGQILLIGVMSLYVAILWKVTSHYRAATAATKR